MEINLESRLKNRLNRRQSQLTSFLSQKEAIGSRLYQMAMKKGISFSLTLIPDRKAFPLLRGENFTLREEDLGNQGLIINQPGCYCFEEDIRFHSLASFAIKIRAHNVTLDLNYFSLRQIGGPQPTTGIIVAPGYDQIEIRNGIIRDFTDQGIWVQGETGNDHDRLCIKRMRIEKCGNPETSGPESRLKIRGGIAIDGCKEVTLDSCLIAKTASNFETAGISILLSENIHLSNSFLLKNRTPGGLSSGVSILFSSFCLLEDLKTFDNLGDEVSGIQIADSTDFILQRVESKGNQGQSISFGIDILLSDRGRICSSQGLSNASGLSVSGFTLSHSNLIEINECSGSDNYSKEEKSLVSGYLLESCQKIIIKNSEAVNNSSSTGDIVAGFLVFLNGDDLSFIDCLAANQFGSHLVGGLISTGIPNLNLSGGQNLKIENSIFRCNSSEDKSKSLGLLLESNSPQGSQAEIRRNQIIGSEIGIELILNAINNRITGNSFFGSFNPPIQDLTRGPNQIENNTVTSMEIICSSGKD